MGNLFLDERLKHALKERALPGLFWGTIVGGLLTALQLVIDVQIAITDALIIAIIVIALILIGSIFGALGTYWWKELRSQSSLPVEEMGKAWWLVPVIFAVLGLVIILLLNISTQQYMMNQKDYWLGAFSFLIIISDFVLIGMGSGSLVVLGIIWWQGREVATKTTPRQKKGWVLRPRIYERLYGWRWNIPIGAIVIVLLASAAFVFFFWGGSGNPQPTAKTATVTVIATVTATKIFVVLPSPTILAPSPTAVPPTATLAPTVPPVPQPPTGVPVVQPTAIPVTAPTKTATVQKPTATRTAPVLICNSTTVAGDTWASVAHNYGITVGALMQKNPGINPAEGGKILKIPRTGCP